MTISFCRQGYRWCCNCNPRSDECIETDSPSRWSEVRAFPRPPGERDEKRNDKIHRRSVVTGDWFPRLQPESCEWPSLTKLERFTLQLLGSDHFELKPGQRETRPTTHEDSEGWTRPRDSPLPPTRPPTSIFTICRIWSSKGLG